MESLAVLLLSGGQAHVFSSKNGACATFLANYHSNSAATVKFNNRNYDLPPWSISILLDCKTDVFNTVRVRFQTTQIQMLPSNSKLFSWETYDEDVSSLAENSKDYSFWTIRPDQCYPRH